MNKNFESKTVIIFLPIIFNICFECSKEPSHSYGSFEYPQHMFISERNELFSMVLISFNLLSSFRNCQCKWIQLKQS